MTTSRSITNQLRRFLPHAVIVIVVMTISAMFRSAFPNWFETPHWTRWILVAFYALIGGALLIRPHGDPDMRPVFNRALGIALLLTAVFGTFYLSGVFGNPEIVR